MERPPADVDLEEVRRRIDQHYARPARSAFGDPPDPDDDEAEEG